MAKGNTKIANSVSVEGDGIILIEFVGKQTLESVQQIGEQLDSLAKDAKRHRRKVLVLVDIKRLGIHDIGSESRLEARKILEDYDYDALAVVGNQKLMMQVMYIVHLAKPNLNVRYFKSKLAALSWLMGSRKRVERQASLSGLINGMIVGLIGLSALIGWQFSIPHLTSFLASARPINPMSALSLVVIGYCFAMYWLGKIRALHIASMYCMVFGILAVLPINIGNWLFAGQVTETGHFGGVSFIGALCFFLTGLIGWLAKRPQRWVRWAEVALVFLVASMGLFSLFAVLYQPDWVDAVASDVVMSLNLSISFLIVAAGMIILVLNRQKGKDVLSSVTSIGWLAALALIIMQAATYAVWQQVTIRNKTESAQAFAAQADEVRTGTEERIQASIQALYGYRGLFGSSQFVSQGEFQSFLNTQKSEDSFAHLRYATFVAKVRSADVPAFVDARRRDTSLLPAGNPDFSVANQSSQPTHYIMAYTTDLSNLKVLGTDLSAIHSQKEIYDKVISSGRVYTSGTVTSLLAGKQPGAKGFFIAVPVKNSNNDQAVGVVTTGFTYSEFFPAIFKLPELQHELLNVTVTDANGMVIYRSQKEQGKIGFSKTYQISIANSGWAMQIEGGKNYGLTRSQVYLARNVIIVGQFFALLLIVTFILQARTRAEALELADQATIDLQHERNEISEIKEKDEAILGGLGEGLILLDKNGFIERINPAGQHILGWSETELKGRHLTEAWAVTDMHYKRVGPSRRPASVVLKSKKTISAKLYYTRKNGQSFPVDINVAPVVVNGELIGAIEVFRDITHDLELDKAKTEFVSLASHQLRTPLSTVKWYTEMLLGGDAGKTSARQKEFLQEIYEGNQRMVELVEALLDVSRLDLGRMPNEPSPTDMKSLIQDIENDLKRMVATKEQKVVNHFEQLGKITADKKQLGMIVQNILVNAIKYTPSKGTVTVSLRRPTRDEMRRAKLRLDPQESVLFMVKDTGYGIPLSQQARIFEKLFRADNVRKLDVIGTGLGLYIVKQILQSMGGAVWFTSVESVGTTFCVIIPHATRASRRLFESE